MKSWIRALAAVWMLTASACGEDKDSDQESDQESAAETTAWCQQECLELGPFVVEESGNPVDLEAYEAGCNALAPATCDACQEELTVHLDRYGIMNECYCLLPSGQREQEVVSDEDCARFLDIISESDLEELCECGD